MTQHDLGPSRDQVVPDRGEIRLDLGVVLCPAGRRGVAIQPSHDPRHDIDVIVVAAAGKLRIGALIGSESGGSVVLQQVLAAPAAGGLEGFNGMPGGSPGGVWAGNAAAPPRRRAPAVRIRTVWDMRMFSLSPGGAAPDGADCS